MTIHKSITLDRIMAACHQRSVFLDNPGLCLACGQDQEGCDPDTEGATCESCGEDQVAGPEMCLMMIF